MVRLLEYRTEARLPNNSMLKALDSREDTRCHRGDYLIEQAFMRVFTLILDRNWPKIAIVPHNLIK